MTELFLIGIGTGNPDHITLAAVKALKSAEIILLPRKGEAKSDLLDLRHLLCDNILEPDSNVQLLEFDIPPRAKEGDYLANVEDWHDAIAEVWQQNIARAKQHSSPKVALLIWGDPSLFDSSLRIAERLKRVEPVKVTVIPGITSLQVLTAEHAIPLNTLAEPIQITTGRRLRERGWPAGVTSVAVMLDSGGAFESLDPTGIKIWWGAYLGMDKQSLIAGPLAEVSDQIISTRAALREQHGWIMDIYLLKKV